MRRLLLFFSAVILFSSFSTLNLNSRPVAVTVVSLQKISEKNLEKIAVLKIRELEKLAGRKLKLKEKVAFKLYQLRLKKELKNSNKDEKPSKGQTAFILGLISMCLLVIPYAIIAALPLATLAVITGKKARKENPKDKKAQTGMILGMITLGIFAVAALFIVAFIASYAGWFGVR